MLELKLVGLAFMKNNIPEDIDILSGCALSFDDRLCQLRRFIATLVRHLVRFEGLQQARFDFVENRHQCLGVDGVLFTFWLLRALQSEDELFDLIWISLSAKSVQKVHQMVSVFEVDL